MNLRTQPTLPFYLFTTGVFLVLISPYLLSDGMFMDGLIYATIANNLANGIGTFWNLQFTQTFFAEFHEHPPLAFGIQSLFYAVLGESRYIDKIYSLITIVVTGFIILKIWKQLALKNSWLPLLLWVSVPLLQWATTNNMLENTMAIFTSLSVLFLLKSQTRHRYLFLFLAGLMLSLGFLTKGFVAFFPWTFPFIWWAVFRQKTFSAMFVDTALVFLFTLIPLVILVFASPVAQLSLYNYLNIQVVNSLKSVVTVDSRFFIIQKLISELIPALILSVLLMFWGWRKKISLTILRKEHKLALVFMLLAFTGVLPIMISMKQSGFYILATFPFFAIALATALNPLVHALFNESFYQSKSYRVFKLSSYVVFIIGVMLSVYFANKIGRDKNKLEDAYAIVSVIPSGTIINILPEMHVDFSLHGYFARYKNISLDNELGNKRAFLLIDKKVALNNNILDSYAKVALPTKDFDLYKLK